MKKPVRYGKIILESGDIVRNFYIRAAAFMQDRYGMDQLNIFILTIAGILYVINLFPRVRNVILIIVILLLVLLVILRALSKNVNKRLYENRRFTDIRRAVTGFFKRQYMKVRDIRTHRYVRCPHCRAHLRLKKRTGTQHIKCPKCGKEFKKNILF